MLAATLRGAFAEAWANRQSFWLQVGAMAVNDLAWVAFWLLFFNRVASIRGWDVQRVLLLFAVLTTVGGVVLGIFANARRVGRLAVDGQLDAVLALPVAPLPYLLLRRIEAANLGDVLFGVLLFAFAGAPSPHRVLLYVAGSIAGIVLLTGFLVAIGSLAFFLGNSDAGELGFHAILLLASYPVDVFTGGMKVMLYTVLPAALVAAVPARLVDAFDVRAAALMAAAAATFALLGWTTFTLGLRRYTSGALWTRA